MGRKIFVVAELNRVRTSTSVRFSCPRLCVFRLVIVPGSTANVIYSL